MFQTIDIRANARFIRPLASPSRSLRFACACTDGTVLVADETGKVLWSAGIDCFPFDFEVTSLLEPGREWLLVAGSDGALYAFCEDGKARWKYQTQGPLFQVCCAVMGKAASPIIFTGGADHHLYALSPEGQLLFRRLLPETEVPGPHEGWPSIRGRGPVRFLRAADVDGSGENALVACETMRFCHHDLLFFKGEGVELIEKKIRFEQPLERGYGMWDLRLIDVDGDGVCEFVFGQGDWKGGGLWVYRKREDQFTFKSLHEADAMHRVDTVYRDTHVVPIRHGGQARLFAQCGHQLCLLGPGLEILEQSFAAFPFMGVASYDMDGRAGLLLASGFGGDENVYRLELGPHWAQEVEGQARTGKIAKASGTLERVRAQVLAAPLAAPPAADEEPIIVQVGCVYVYRHRLAELPHYLAHNAWVRRQFPYPGLQLATMVAISEKMPTGASHGLLGSRFDAEEVVQILGKFEESGTPFMLYLNQGLAVSLGAKTIARIADACPSTFLGCYSVETGLGQPTTAESKQLFEGFLDTSILPVLELLRERGKKLLFNEKWNFWLSSALLPGVWSRLFSGRYRQVIIPCTEDSATRSPELGFAARFGLWLSCAVDRWGTRATADDFGNSHVPIGGNPAMSGHQPLRKFLAQAAMGATVFQFNVGQDNGSGEPCYHPSQGDVFLWTRVGWESEAIFLHMLGKGLFRPPRREALANLSRVALAIEPSETFAFTANNNYYLEAFTDDRHDAEHVFSRLSYEWTWGPSHPNHFSSLVYGQKRQGLGFAPSTPYGFVAIVPRAGHTGDRTGLRAGEGGAAHLLDARLNTDGVGGFDGGQALEPKRWRELLLERLGAAREALPFSCEGDVFMGVMRRDGGFDLLVVDADSLLLVDKTVTLKIQNRETREMIDALSGEHLAIQGDRVRLTVPAGAFRLLRAR